ncbi:hypothetical protein [Asanoa sp. NPDC050611]|uniref:hypothetical protein n=1 Tax=Asanoa sp. NPDC050611 TaxID=3157098 RepID=UPI003403D527
MASNSAGPTTGAVRGRRAVGARAVSALRTASPRGTGRSYRSETTAEPRRRCGRATRCRTRCGAGSTGADQGVCRQYATTTRTRRTRSPASGPVATSRSRSVEPATTSAVPPSRTTRVPTAPASRSGAMARSSAYTIYQ